MKDSAGKFIRKARERADLNQTALAKVLGYHTSQYISDWERDKYRVPLDKIEPIAKILGISSRDLLFVCYPEVKKILSEK